MLAAYCLLPTAFFSACGKIGDPLPPIPRAPLVVSELAATQSGNRITLTFPLVRTPRSERLGRIDIYRLTEPINAPPGLTEEDFSARSTIIHSIPAEQIPDKSATITYPDLIDFKNVPGNTSYRYAVRLVNQAGRAAGFSNYATVTLLTGIAQPPTDLRTQLSQTELVLTWSPPAANENGTKPANVAGYNVYRRAGEAVSKLNAQPVRGPRFIDRSFQFGTRYEYFVRSLSLTLSGARVTNAIESNDSAAVTITPKDIFPPSAPTSITIASINGVVSLFWPSNPEPDLAGYNIYRSEDEQAPPEKWVKLNAQLHTPTSFQDNKVQVEKRYFYQLTAVDNAGNESARSATYSEKVNP